MLDKVEKRNRILVRVLKSLFALHSLRKIFENLYYVRLLLFLHLGRGLNPPLSHVSRAGSGQRNIKHS